MTKKLLGAALILTGASAIAGPLDYNRINLTGNLLFADDNDSQAINFSLNERLDGGFFYEINSSVTVVDSEDLKTLQGVWGYSFKADNVDFGFSLIGTRGWKSTGGAETVKHYNAELTLPLASNLYVEVGYINTFIEDYKEETYALSLEGGKFDGFQWELSSQPKADDENLKADFYIPTSRDGKWVIGASVVNSEGIAYGIHGGYHWIFGADAPRKASPAAAAVIQANTGTPAKPVVNNEEAVDPIAPERIDEYAGMEDKSAEEIDRMQADAESAEDDETEDETEADEEEAEDSKPSSSKPTAEEYQDDDLDFLFE